MKNPPELDEEEELEVVLEVVEVVTAGVEIEPGVTPGVPLACVLFAYSSAFFRVYSASAWLAA